MALTRYSHGDLVVQRQGFGPCGQVVGSADGICQVKIGQQILKLSEDELFLISVKNIPNLRLIEQKIMEAHGALPDDAGLDHMMIGYLGGGSVISRALADYVAKIPVDTLVQCLQELHHTGLNIPDAIDKVLGLNFKLISGAG
ncbi:MAG: hypothetical protein WBA57_11235 [Elainellaceae cyanobacterium]